MSLALGWTCKLCLRSAEFSAVPDLLQFDAAHECNDEPGSVQDALAVAKALIGGAS